MEAIILIFVCKWCNPYQLNSRISLSFGTQLDEPDFLEFALEHTAEFEKPEVVVGHFSVYF